MICADKVWELIVQRIFIYLSFCQFDVCSQREAVVVQVEGRMTWPVLAIILLLMIPRQQGPHGESMLVCGFKWPYAITRPTWGRIRGFALIAYSSYAPAINGTSSRSQTNSVTLQKLLSWKENTLSSPFSCACRWVFYLNLVCLYV